MNVQFTEKKLIEVFCEIDDLLNDYKIYREEQGTPIKELQTHLSCSEILTILVMYHLSGYKNFEYYYKNQILGRNKKDFPKAVKYQTFLGYIPKCEQAILLWLVYMCSKSKRTNMYIVDSKKLEVCHIKREKQNKVFHGVARKGKGSMGWFYGLKIHLVINNLGEIVSFALTSGNVADNNQDLLKYLFQKLEGIVIGDKGYKTALFQWFYENKLHVLTKPKKKMKKLPVENKYNLLLNKRAVIESVFDILSSICDIDHSRHRSPSNAFVSIYASLIAYQYMDKKPCVFVNQESLKSAA